MKEKEKIAATTVDIDEEKLHFMNVCIHGVPHGRPCIGCNKIISIPEDAVIKPEGYVKAE